MATVVAVSLQLIECVFHHSSQYGIKRVVNIIIIIIIIIGLKNEI